MSNRNRGGHQAAPAQAVEPVVEDREPAAEVAEQAAADLTVEEVIANLEAAEARGERALPPEALTQRDVTATGRTDVTSNDTVVEDRSDAEPADAYRGRVEVERTKLDNGTVLETYR